MEMKKGYKQTEVGVIPEDWEVKKLGDISTEVGDGIHATPRYVDSSDYFFINGNNLVDGRILITEDTKCVSRQEYYSLRKKLSDRTILMSINGTIGNLAYFNNENIVLGKSAAYINLKEELGKSLIYYFLQHASIINFYENELTGTTIRNLSLKSIRETPIPLPPTKAEQTTIAAALYDADALISSLKKLIAKKRNIKQGAMQELLTGKKRLPGFSGEWEVKKLGEIFNISAGGDFAPSQSSSIQDEIYCYPIYSNAISEKGLYGYCSYNDHEADSITVTARGTLGIANYRDHKFTAIGRVLVLEPKEPIDGRFFSEFINNRIYFVVESTGVPQLTAPQISNYELPVPLLPEQAAIAQVLSDMDAEIEKLEKKVAKYRQIKQGMMQELLTGKIRLV